MKLILYLVSKASNVYAQKSGQGPITLGVTSLGRFSKFHINFLNLLCLRSYFDETYATLGL